MAEEETKTDGGEINECEGKDDALHDEFNPKNDWVSFEEEREIPILPQPMKNVHNMSSEKYIDRLEKKLCKMKDSSRVTSKNIVSALTEARESQMNSMMTEKSSGHNSVQQYHTTEEMNWSDDVRESNCCCVSCYRYLFPKQAQTSQEVECLLDEDELAIVSSQEFEDTGHQFTIG